MTETVSRPPALEMRGITKRYPGVVANDGIDLDVRPGRDPRPARRERRRQVDPDEHPVRAGHARTRARSSSTARPSRSSGPSDAIAARHQHGPPALHAGAGPVASPTTSCSARRRWPTRSSSTGTRPSRRIIELGKRFGFEIDPDVKVEALSVGWQQRVEILKALYREARILVLDEPTAVLTPQETKEIFAVLRRLARRGPQHHLHQPQALRGPRDRRPDHGHPARQGRRARASRPRPTRTTSPR